MTDLITELKALKEKATPGPWRVGGEPALKIHPKRDQAVVCECWQGGVDGPANAALIVALVNHLPTILAKLEEGERMREALTRLVADVAYYPAWQRPCHAFDVARAALESTHDHT